MLCAFAVVLCECPPLTGMVIHHNTTDNPVSASIFWSFMILVFFVPGTVALIMVAVLIHLVNYVS